MKILIIVTMTNNFGTKGFYNSQEIGMAEAFVEKGYYVDVYKAVRDGEEITRENIFDHCWITYIPCKHLGANGLLSLNYLKPEYDAVIQFADTQLTVPRIYKWCLKNKIKYIPYIGITRSQSINKVIRKIINLMYKRNLSVFKKSYCVVKNGDAYHSLKKDGIKNVTIAPVGVNLKMLHKNYLIDSGDDLRYKWGYSVDDKIILFVGRLEEDKRPIDLLRIIRQLYSENKNYRLILVGKGYYSDAVEKFIKENCLQSCVNWIKQIENKDIWELYRICTFFINLNKTEIFGMVLLEAMYYECNVVALNAPGPAQMLIDGKNGYLVNSDNELMDRIRGEKDESLGKRAHERVVCEFTWKQTITKFVRIITKKE